MNRFTPFIYRKHLVENRIDPVFPFAQCAMMRNIARGARQSVIVALVPTLHGGSRSLVLRLVAFWGNSKHMTVPIQPPHVLTQSCSYPFQQYDYGLIRSNNLTNRKKHGILPIG